MGLQSGGCFGRTEGRAVLMVLRVWLAEGEEEEDDGEGDKSLSHGWSSP